MDLWILLSTISSNITLVKTEDILWEFFLVSMGGWILSFVSGIVLELREHRKAFCNYREEIVKLNIHLESVKIEFQRLQINMTEKISIIEQKLSLLKQERENNEEMLVFIRQEVSQLKAIIFNYKIDHI